MVIKEKIMKKYRCPICKTEFQGKLEICPTCGQELHYLDEEVKKEVESGVKAPKVEFYYDDDRILNDGILTDEEMEGEVILRHAPEKKISKGTNEGLVIGDSYFDGKKIQLIGWKLLGFLITIVTLFIGFPFAMCLVYRWEMRHTVIQGRRLDFDGKASQLFGRWLLWLLLTILTVGIFLFWLPINVKKWKVKHTIFMK